MTENELISKIITAAQAYYSGTSIISDASFDVLVKRLKLTNPDHPVLKTVGWGYEIVGEDKENHRTIIGSLDKVRHNEVTNILLQAKPIATPKLDGGSAVAYYHSGYLQRIISRGNGTEGINITPNLIHAVPLIIDNKIADEIGIRGEIVLTEQAFGGIGGSSARNKAVGLSQRKFTDSETKQLKFIAYSIVWSLEEIKLSKIRQLEFLLNNGFTIPRVAHIKTTEDLENFYKEANKLGNDSIQIDGIVLSDNTTQNIPVSLGYTVANDSIAVKFEEESGIAKILNIEWSVNRTGRVVPIATITPTELSGAILQRVTCYNHAFLVDMKLGIGAEVRLVRANEVIPKIVETITPADSFEHPALCPVCKTLLTFTDTGIDLICPNTNCPAKLETSLLRVFELTKPDGLGDINLEVLSSLILGNKTGMTFESIFKNLNNWLICYRTNKPVIQGIIAKNFGNHISVLVEETIQNILNYTPKISDIVYIANIPTVGGTTGEKLNSLGTQEFLAMLSTKDFSKAGDAFRSGISFNNFHIYLSRLNTVLAIFPNGLKNSNYTVGGKWFVAVTGKMSTSRESWYKLHPELTESDVKATTKYLVTNEVSSSSKYQAALKLKVPIVSEEDFEKIYKEEFKC